MTSIISEISVPLRENLFNNKIRKSLKLVYEKYNVIAYDCNGYDCLYGAEG